jgi:HAD superfamily hydrolase (TIGR01549 family)
MPTPLILPRAILFDMDGTLTAPMLDFPRIKAEMGIGSRPILEALAELPADARRIAEEVLHRHEETAAADSTLNPGCVELLDWLARRNISVALITRNSLTSVRTVMRRHGLAIDVLITRDDGRFKPDPHPLHLACQRLNMPPADVWMVGDGRYDVEAGVAAKIKTVWVSHGREPDFDTKPWRVVRDLVELTEMLAKCQ